MVGHYRMGGRNTTSEELDEYEKLIIRFKSESFQTINNELIDFVNRVTKRAYEDGYIDGKQTYRDNY